MTAEQKKWDIVVRNASLVREASDLLRQHPEGMEADLLAKNIFKMKTFPAGMAEKMLTTLFQSDDRFYWENGRWHIKWKPFSWKRPLAATSFVVLDVEIIGRGKSAKIVELAAVKIRNAQLQEEFYSLVNPGRPLSPGWFKKPRFSEAELRGAPKIETVLNDFLHFAEQTVWVAHNAHFDLRILNLELQRITYFHIVNPVLDTLPLTRQLFPGLDRYHLPQLANYFGIDFTARHRAQSDAQALARIFLKVLHYLENEGHTTLEVLEPFSLQHL